MFTGLKELKLGLMYIRHQAGGLRIIFWSFLAKKFPEQNLTSRYCKISSMTSLKVAIDSGPLSDGHSVRGIGVMVREQIEALKNLKTKELKRIVIENFDFQNEDG